MPVGAHVLACEHATRLRFAADGGPRDHELPRLERIVSAERTILNADGMATVIPEIRRKLRGDN